MQVAATAGHVDHGKSTLLRALTGMEPDRWAEERRRGMTIDLGFVWTTLPGGRTVAFVDVPGHERFVPNMLAGVGPVPAVLLVVAADGGWMPQTQEHVDALDALGVRHGLLVVTRADLADPLPALESARERLAGTTLADVPAVAVSPVSGLGMDELREALGKLADDLPVPDPRAPVRLWIDRAFSIRGAGTVVTGTLGAGTIRAGDALELNGGKVRVRGLQALGADADAVPALARVAVNLRGLDREDVARGDALLDPAGPWRSTVQVDARLDGTSIENLVLHLGSAAVPVRVRPLGGDTVRLTLRRPLPLVAGDTGLLRDPARHAVAARVTVLDVDPPALTRRGAAAARADELASGEALPRRKVVRASELRATGVTPPEDAVEAGEWLIDAGHAAGLRRRIAELVAAHAEPLVPGPSLEQVRAALDLPDVAIVAALTAPPLRVRDGRVVDGTVRLPAEIADAVAAVARELAAAPFAAPDANRLRELGLGIRELAAAERAHALLRVAEGVVLLPDAAERAAETLARLPQPFTLSEARQALGTSRRVAVPLLELLDRRRLTRRLPDDRRTTA